MPICHSDVRGLFFISKQVLTAFAHSTEQSWGKANGVLGRIPRDSRDKARNATRLPTRHTTDTTDKTRRTDTTKPPIM
jgi:hypothetical protein